MEQNGGTQPIGRPQDFITLAAPRSGAARQQNEYIETPLRPPLPGRPKQQEPRSKAAAITAQPVKEKGTDERPPHAAESIICRQCRLCKCESCRAPRHLPSAWICDDKCLCSARNVVDYCSCVCCVKGLFYHWAKDYETDNGSSCADQPCSCAPHKRWLRWGCLGLLSLPLPCLCCYWPLTGCAKLCDRCYSGCPPGRGCRCEPPHRTAPAPEKRLLDPHADC